MIGSTMHCTCGKYEENMVVILGPEWGNFEPNPPEMAVCKNCGLLPPIKTPGLFIQGDTYQGDKKVTPDKIWEMIQGFRRQHLFSRINEPEILIKMNPDDWMCLLSSLFINDHILKLCGDCKEIFGCKVVVSDGVDSLIVEYIEGDDK